MGENDTPKIPSEEHLSKRAILVIHGIGEQQRFETLDRFARGLLRQLQSPKKPATVSHHSRTNEQRQEEFVRIQADKEILDVHELYWAPLAVNKATFGAIVRWLYTTSLTPVRRLAFNLPFHIFRALNRARKYATGASMPGQQAPSSTSKFHSGPNALLTGITEGASKMFVSWPGFMAGTILEFFKELIRVVVVVILLAVLAWIVNGLVSAISANQSKLKELIKTFPGYSTADIPASLIFIFASVIAVAVAGSLIQQVRDFWQIRKLMPTDPNANDAERWKAELLGRSLILVVSTIVPFALTWWVIIPMLAGSAPFGSARLTDVVHRTWTWLQDPIIYVGAAGASIMLLTGLVLKKAFVDYIADIAVYTTSNESSPLAKTRAEIQEAAARKLRWLLRSKDYAVLAVAGHSLGSVIGYDAINRLRTEARMNTPSQRSGAEGVAGAGPVIRFDELKKLQVFITFGSPLNKVLYFFRTKIASDQKIRAHILHNLHGFRRQPELRFHDPAIRDEDAQSGSESTFEGTMHWLNVYAPADPVSAKLDFYEDVHEYRRWYWIPGFCHMGYWEDSKFYEEVLAALDKKFVRAQAPEARYIDRKSKPLIVFGVAWTLGLSYLALQLYDSGYHWWWLLPAYLALGGIPLVWKGIK